MPRKKTKTDPKSIVPAYEPTEFEKQLMERRHRRRAAHPTAPRMVIGKKAGVLEVAVDHPDNILGTHRLMEAFGTDDFDLFDGLLHQLINAGTQGQDVNEKQLNFMLSMVKGIEPRDAIESMLAAQMAAVQCLTMTYARKLAHVQTIVQQDSAERTFNKLARTFTAQIDALKRYRSKGEQRMVVQHQHLNVAATSAQVNVGTEGASNFLEEPPHAPENERLSYEPGTALPGQIQAIQAALPRTGRKRA